MNSFGGFVDILRYRAAEQKNCEAYLMLANRGRTSTSLTYGLLDEKVRSIAAHLQQACKRGDRVLIVYPPGIDYIYAFYACLYASVIAVPSYPPTRAGGSRAASRLQAIAQNAGASCVLTTSDLLPGLQKHFIDDAQGASIRLVATDSLEDASDAWTYRSASPNDLAFLQYTSGSTGDPKGVMVSHGNLLSNSELIRRRFGHTSESRGVIWLPPYHDMGLIGGVLQPLYAGFPTVLMSPVSFVQSPLLWLETISKYRATTSGGPDFAYAQCISEIADEQCAALDLSCWKVAFTGAEPIRSETLERFSRKFAACGFDAQAIYPCYGLAESTLFVSGSQAESGFRRLTVDGSHLAQHRVVEASGQSASALHLIGCGSAAQVDHELVVVDPATHQPVGEDQVGEIWVRGPSVARGYWNAPAVSEQVFGARLADGAGPYLRCGDLGFLRDGELFVSGRIKDLIIVRGRNHYPHDIENTVALAEAGLAAGGSIAAILDDKDRLVVLSEGSAISDAQSDRVWRNVSHAVTQAHGLPLDELVIVKPRSLPKTSSGKLKRFACRQLYLQQQLPVIQRLSANASPPAVVAGESTAAPPPSTASTAELRHWIQAAIARATRQTPDAVDPDREFFEIGLDSLELTRMAADLEEKLGRPVDTGWFFDFPTINRLSAYLAGDHAAASHRPAPERLPKETSHRQAIIGLSCRFPGAEHDAQFWQLLATGRAAISEIPAERWDARHTAGAVAQPGASVSKWGGFIPDVDLFDAELFNIASREAARIDPQHRVLLELAFEALQNAGLSIAALKGSQTGVFVGLSSSDYMLLNGDVRDSDAYSGIGNAHSAAANRISYFFDFNGPSLVVDTACSSSLVALHLAIQSLQAGECDLALVGGVNLMLSPHLHVVFSQAGMLAADGRCKAFDDSADGYVRGEGAGFVVLRRMPDALRLRERVLACVLGSAINQDGRTNGITAPNLRAQEAVMRAALDNAGLSASAVSYVEAHGTGTKLGDPIEYRALRNVYCADERSSPLLIGSVKSNIGHLEAAAGIAGLIKVVLALRHRIIPAHLHYRQLNRQIQHAGTDVEVCSEQRDWEGVDGKRIAGISSFGFGGTNAHVLISDVTEQPCTAVTKQESIPPLLTLSAGSRSALRRLCIRYAEQVQAASGERLAALCYSSNIADAGLGYRWAGTAVDGAALARQLERHAKAADGAVVKSRVPGVVFAFSGQGSQIPGMGQALEQCFPVFRAAIDRCDALLRPQWGATRLRSVLYAQQSGDNTLLDQTAYAQPAIFSYQYALAQLWLSLGVKPSGVLGHSLGEYAAACIAGVMTLEHALPLVAARASLMQSVRDDGAMAALFADERQVMQLLQPFAGRISLAAINAPEIMVVSGRDSDVRQLCAQAADRQITYKQLPGSRAFHSADLDAVVSEFERIAGKVSYAVPRVSWFCNLNGEQASFASPVSGHYWRDQMRGTVQFARCLTQAAKAGAGVLLELGADATLCALAARSAESGTLKCIPSARVGRDERAAFSDALAALYKAGVPIDWNALHADTALERVELPPYPFDRKRFWLSASRSNHPAAAAAQDKASANHLSRSETMTQQANRFHSQTQLEPRTSLLDEVRQLVASLLEADASQLDDDAPFLEMGADSLVLLSAIQALEDKYGIHLSINQLFGDISTIRALAAFVEANAVILSAGKHDIDAENAHKDDAAVVLPDSFPIPGFGAAGNNAGISAVLTAQLQIISEQLALMKSDVAAVIHPLAASHSATPRLAGKASASSVPATAAQKRFAWAKVDADAQQSHGLPAWARPPVLASDSSDAQVKTCLDDLLASHIARTPRSKSMAQQYRPVLADNRASAGFRLSTKEGVYPIVGKRAQGARMWDIDGNEYVDFTMGFGANLFGHSPDFIVEQLHRQIDDGFQLGPQSDLAGVVAERIARMTKQERVAFCNSGSEAVMTAVRLARTATKRSKVAIFSGSYHGTFDGILARARVADGELLTVPVAPGTPESYVEREVLVLDYGQADALRILRENAHQIAALIVEPVQSRFPNHQPVEFLRALRALTAEHSIALIWDEVITGFRAAPGGAQEYFGITADITTYGKIIGGGMPIGVVAGKARFLDAIDGGVWSYGDASYPKAEQTFFAGTFCKHPLTMRAALAVLDHLEAAGPALQHLLNKRTAALAHTLNTFFVGEDIPLRVEHFTSLFRFTFSGNMDVLFLKLMNKGIYIWEGRNCFLSTAHTDDDVRILIDAVKSSVLELRAHGFFAPGKPGPELAITPSQARFAHWARRADDAPICHIPFAIRLSGESLDEQALEDAFNKVIERHDILRAAYSSSLEHQRITAAARISMERVDLCDIATARQAQAVSDWQQAEVGRPFDLSAPPLMRVSLLRLSAAECVLHLTVHHLICDGMSLALLLDEVSRLYEAGGDVARAGLARPMAFSGNMGSASPTESEQESATYWRNQLAAPLPAMFKNTPVDGAECAGGRVRMVLDAATLRSVKQAAKQCKCTPFMLLFSAYSLLLAEKSGQQDILVGVPWIDHMSPSGQVMLGCFVSMLPIRQLVDVDAGLETLIEQAKGQLLKAYRHASQVNQAGKWMPQATFNLEPQLAPPRFGGMRAELIECPIRHVEFDVMLNATETPDGLFLDLDYRQRALSAPLAREWLERYRQIVDGILVLHTSNEPNHAV